MRTAAFATVAGNIDRRLPGEGFDPRVIREGRSEADRIYVIVFRPGNGRARSDEFR
jgi:hypothetical protein